LISSGIFDETPLKSAMANKKEEHDLTKIIWLEIDFFCVKRRIETINNQIQAVLLKYESQLTEDFSSQLGSIEHNV
jgi:hypothetical protein